ncbi:histidine kinase [uncultured Chitinophaga sp.]|jgi:Putative regulator of cell autolysis|uniref:sensor histidine kinase n=1 Tax=uncultured Chitinophaga sp. TaxID=339340 RepID=UPI0026198F33|nr:histidine kinase [uncultured Chitinophaga sp.]
MTLLKKYDRFVILIWIFLTIVFWFRYIPDSSVLEGGLLACCIMLCLYPFTTYLSTTLLQKALRQKQMLLFAGQFFLVSAISALWIPAILHGFLYLEQSGLLPSSDLLLGRNRFGIMYINALLVALFVNFGFCGLRFHEESMKLHEALVESQLRILQQQISPHFMFNVLNHINILMQEDVNLASSLLIRYSKILRYQLDSNKNSKVSIAQEVQFLKDFIEIEKVRWGDELTINCSWKIEDMQKTFPPLLLITFIENAFKHVARGISEMVYVNIAFEQMANSVSLEVENSKSGIQQEKDPVSGIGLENVKKRLELLYGEHYDLTIRDAETTYYTKLVVKL